MSAIEVDRLITTADATEILGGIDRKTLDRLVLRDGLPRYKVGARNLYRLSEVTAWVDERKVRPDADSTRITSHPSDSDRHAAAARLNWRGPGRAQRREAAR